MDVAEYTQLTLDEYIQCKTEIRNSLTGMVKSFVRIGWQLSRIDRSGAYKLDGYNTIAEFAKAEYDMTPSGVSRFISVYERYSAAGDTPELKEEYREFKFAQLVEMLQIPQEDHSLIRPETKREDIRELQKFNKENENNPDNLLNWKQKPENKLETVVIEFFREKEGLLNDLYNSDGFRTGNIEAMVDIINPSGNRSYRKGTVFLAMYEAGEGVMVKQFGQTPQKLSWQEFIGVVRGIFDGAAGPDTYKNFFQTKTPEYTEKSMYGAVSEGAEKPVGEDPEHKDSEGKTPPAEPDYQGKEDTAEGHPEETAEIAPAQNIPGQMEIEEFTEFMPRPETPEYTEKSMCGAVSGNTSGEDKNDSDTVIPETASEMTRKEYIDTLTAYGTADYLARSMREFASTSFRELQNINTWLPWLEEKVDHAGRTIIEDAD